MAKRSKRRDSWGSITEIERGKRYRIRYWAETSDGYKRRSKTIRGTRKDAEQVRARLLLEHGEDKPCPTVAQAWETYTLPYYQRLVEQGEYAQSTVSSYKSRWNVHINPKWGSVPCDAVTPLEMQFGEVFVITTAHLPPVFLDTRDVLCTSITQLGRARDSKFV